MTKLNRWHGKFDLKIFTIKQGRTSFALVWLMLEFQLKPITGGASRLSCLSFTLWHSCPLQAVAYQKWSKFPLIKSSDILKSPFHAFSRVNAQSNARRETHFTLQRLCFTLRASPKRFYTTTDSVFTGYATGNGFDLKLAVNLHPIERGQILKKKLFAKNSREQKKWIFKNNKINSLPLCLETKNLPVTYSK